MPGILILIRSLSEKVQRGKFKYESNNCHIKFNFRNIYYLDIYITQLFICLLLVSY